MLRCPVSQQDLDLQVIKECTRNFNGNEIRVIEEGILVSSAWLYPIVNGIPRLCVESFLDYDLFLRTYVDDYEFRKKKLFELHGDLIRKTLQKNRRTKQSFDAEWNLYDIEKDNTWDAGGADLVTRFLKETDESLSAIKQKIIFDAGCGNGKLNCLLANEGIVNFAMDFSNSIEKAYRYNTSENVHFIQGDVQYPPFAQGIFDIVHCSGVLIHTKNTEFSFSCLTPFVKRKGKLSVWLYHPRKDLIHNTINKVRSVTSKLPFKLQYYIYLFSLYPLSFVIKKLKGNRQNKREMMIDILDWFSPQYRWEHTHSEASSWFAERGFGNIKVTTENIFGFNIIGEKEIDNIK